MDTAQQYLLSYLEDEFRDDSRFRIRPTPKTGTRRSVDLVQDYDPESNDLHLLNGVFVKFSSREYYFPCQWVHAKNFQEIRKLVEEIRNRAG
jgi:hypothetical protein